MISKAPKLRGQAFVTFKEISDASAAIKRLQVISFKDRTGCVSRESDCYQFLGISILR